MFTIIKFFIEVTFSLRTFLNDSSDSSDPSDPNDFSDSSDPSDSKTLVPIPSSLSLFVTITSVAS